MLNIETQSITTFSIVQQRALTQLAEQGEGVERAVLLLQALESWKQAGELAHAREVLERVLKEAPGMVSATDAGRRFLELEAPKRALEVAFMPALRAGRHDEALALAEAAGDAAWFDSRFRILTLHRPRPVGNVPRPTRKMTNAGC